MATTESDEIDISGYGNALAVETEGKQAEAPARPRFRDPPQAKDRRAAHLPPQVTPTRRSIANAAPDDQPPLRPTAEDALKPLVRILARQAARETIAPPTHKEATDE
jgi:hypothetical protein